ncbi:MAG: hypothetical protein HQK84_10630, partial [Nitrospinae bacterium]|nr:hypothetical protein [Nitrospinota bacterium]
MKKKLCHFLPFLLLTFLFSGCGSIGPTIMKGERFNYNNAISRSNNEQLLLNLVRLKYRDNPYFLNINSVTSQLTLQGSAEASVSVPDTWNKTSSGKIGGVYSEKPTISYAPLQGNEFIQYMLTPISLETLALLYNSGWSSKRLLVATVQRINNIPNAPTASGPTPEKAPEFKRFIQFASLMEELRQEENIFLTIAQNKGVE